MAKIYQYLVTGQGDKTANEMQNWLLKKIMEYSSILNIGHIFIKYGNEVICGVGVERLSVFNNEKQVILIANEDFEEGNGLLDYIFHSLQKDQYTLQCLHLSNFFTEKRLP